MKQAVFALLFALVSTTKLHAHKVTWWGNWLGFSPGTTLDLYYDPDTDDQAAPDEDAWESIWVVPSAFEPCTVKVNLDPLESSLIDAFVTTPFGIGNEVEIVVWPTRAPLFYMETATLSGEWHATGWPNGAGCTSTNPNDFTVTVKVYDEHPPWCEICYERELSMFALFAPRKITLQAADSPFGPWRNIGIGQSFRIPNDKPGQYFRSLTKLGSNFGGLVVDPNDAPLSGITVDFPYGGLGTTNQFGYFEMGALPRGDNALLLGKLISFFDWGSSTQRTERVSAELIVPMSSTAVSAWLYADMGVATPPGTSNCHCVPWCAIDFGTLNDEPIAVYYSGGVFPPLSDPQADCGPVKVTVTDPKGSKFQINPGKNRFQNSGPKPASGKWSVTSEACGQSVTRTVTVP